MLVASSQHVQRLPIPLKFSLQILGTRSVDSGYLGMNLDQTWRTDDHPHVPWSAKDMAGHRAIFILADLRGKLDIRRYTMTCRRSDPCLVDA